MLGFAPVEGADGRPEQRQELDAGGCKLALHKAHGPDGPIDKPTGSRSATADKAASRGDSAT